MTADVKRRKTVVDRFSPSRLSPATITGGGNDTVYSEAIILSRSATDDEGGVP